MENEKIEVDEFVRTKDGQIGVFVKYSSRKDNSIYKSPFNCFIKLRNRKSNLQCHRDYIVKHSKNIIDLIEVGDIVRVLVNIKTQETMIYTIDCEADLSLLREWNVKSVLTKEQFAQIEYKVGE